MAKQKRGPRPPSRPRPPSSGRTERAREPSKAGSPRDDRQARKRRAREAREAAERARRRRDTLRRALGSGVVGVVIVAGFLYLTRVPGPNPIPTAAVTAARDAGCTTVQTPVADPVRTHLQPGQAYTYPSEPATSGPHDPYPYPDTPAVFPAMPEETKLVHNLEHGFVVIDYRAGSEAPLPQDVVDTLTTYVQGAGHVFLTPHPSLPDGVALAMTYWNRIQTCPATITPDQARAVASGFVTAFECSNVAPEARNC